MKPATEILLSAAFVLTPKENWCQRKYETPGGRMCMATAVNKTAHALGFGYCGVMNARDYVYRVIGPLVSMVDFNDANGRTHAEVLDALYRAAEIAEGQS